MEQACPRNEHAPIGSKELCSSALPPLAAGGSSNLQALASGSFHYSLILFILSFTLRIFAPPN
jgi:hypothetical protein